LSELTGQLDGSPTPMVDRETFYRNVVHSLRNGVVAIWRDGSLAVVNDSACRILGLERDAGQIGRHYRDVLGSDHDPSNVLSLAFTEPELPNRAELRLRSSGRAIGYTLCRIADRDGTVSGAALLFKDLTRVEQLEERERLRDRLAALGEMAAAIAHEVKNPLAGIQVMSGVLKRQLPDSPDAHQLLNDIINEAKMANRIVVEVLEFVRPINLQVAPVGIAGVLDRAVAATRSQHLGEGTAIVTDYASGIPDLDADGLQLRQLFTNLLINAIEALSGEGHIWVTASYAAAEDMGESTEPPNYTGFVTVDVADDGPGVPVEVSDRMFSPFFTTKPQGSGLGLAIVRKIVNAHDGRIDVRARYGGGARFRVRLPVTVHVVVQAPVTSDEHSARGTDVQATNPRRG
jgi:PAS domain S-box-containing protein